MIAPNLLYYCPHCQDIIPDDEVIIEFGTSTISKARYTCNRCTSDLFLYGIIFR